MHLTMHVTQESCRICLETLSETISFKDHIPSKQISYTDLYQNVSGMTLVHTGPQRLCLQCGDNLIKAYDLKKRIKESEKLLLTLVDVSSDLPSIKEERSENLSTNDDTVDFDFGTTIEADVDAVSVKLEPENLKSEETSESDADDDTKLNLRKRPKKKVKEVKRRKTKRQKQESLSLECSICSQVFTKKYDFRNHYRVLHAGEEIRCPNCTRVFTNADEFGVFFVIFSCKIIIFFMFFLLL